MPELYQINPALEIPLYRQLVDRLRAEIKSGALPRDTQLPTVRALAEELHIARGTVKRAYDELEAQRLVEKVQGRGTFVRFCPEAADSRKERAMAAIDRLLDELEGLDFSMNEMSIFLRLKLQERAARERNLRVAVVECTPEVLSQLSEQLRSLGKLDLYAFLLDDVLAYPYKLGEDMDLVITTQEHAEALEKVLSDSRKLARIALRPHSRCVAQLGKLQAGEQVGILCGSPRFGELLTRICRTYAEQAAVAPPCLFGGDCAAYLAGKSAVLVPENCARFADGGTLRLLDAFSARGRVISCSYRVDEGSLMYLEEKLRHLLEKDRL